MFKCYHLRGKIQACEMLIFQWLNSASLHFGQIVADGFRHIITKEMMHYAHVLLFSCHDVHVSARNHRVSNLAEKMPAGNLEKL